VSWCLVLRLSRLGSGCSGVCGVGCVSQAGIQAGRDSSGGAGFFRRVLR
jgi:hypothetical protein